MIGEESPECLKEVAESIRTTSIDDCDGSALEPGPQVPDLARISTTGTVQQFLEAMYAS